jgi:hypothetical protein
MQQRLGDFSHSVHCNAISLLNGQRMIGWFQFHEWALPNLSSMHVRL